MSATHIILDNLPSLCQKLSDLVEVWHSYNKKNFACFFETRCNALINLTYTNIFDAFTRRPRGCLNYVRT